LTLGLHYLILFRGEEDEEEEFQIVLDQDNLDKNAYLCTSLERERTREEN
jgi:hypothetical protein